MCLKDNNIKVVVVGLIKVITGFNKLKGKR
jgi:hypothetical protein